jgi:hypothetical protein
MVAEDCYKQIHCRDEYLFSADFNTKTGETRYHIPPGHHLNRDTQLRFTRAFAQKHARIDDEGLKAHTKKSRKHNRASERSSASDARLL